MNMIALSVAFVCALSSLGVAAWTLHAMASVGDELSDFAGFDGMRFND